jgi:DNA-binding YbaB/EbfC family protein
VNINPFDILKSAQKIQEQMGSFQEKLADIHVTGSSGGGMVEIDLNGKMEALAVRISPETMEDRDMLQDLVLAAFNSGMEKAREAIQGQIGSLSGLQGIPGMGGFQA